MRTVHKFELPETFGEPFQISLPRSAKVIHVGQKPGTKYLNMWVDTDTEQQACIRKFVVYGTGWGISKDQHVARSQHCGTCITDAGFVWHLYEVFEQGL